MSGGWFNTSVKKELHIKGNEECELCATWKSRRILLRLKTLERHATERNDAIQQGRHVGQPCGRRSEEEARRNIKKLNKQGELENVQLALNGVIPANSIFV